MAKHAFKFISGKYQGGEFPLPANGELVIGRAADADLVLVEDMVSRKHARVLSQAGRVTISDLGSTNGTFVNGEKVEQAELRKDDRVLIGTSILKVMQLDSSDTDFGMPDKESLRAMMDNLGKRGSPSTSMSGDLEDVPLPDLLQLFATNKKTGVLSVGGQGRARLYLKDGDLQHVTLQNEPNMLPQKLVCRLVSWSKGPFQFEPLLEAADVAPMFHTTTENVLIEALRQNDEAKRLLSTMPSLDSTLSLCIPVPGRLADLTTQDLDTLQLALNFARLRSVLDKAQVADSEILTSLQKLLKAGILSAS